MTKSESTPGPGAAAIGYITLVVLVLVVDGVAFDGKGKAWLFSLFSDSASSSAAAEASPPSDVGPAILAAAKKYDSEKYVWGGGHPPTSFSKGKGVDCSGLINVAVKDATGVNEDRVAKNFRTSPHWSKVAAKEDAKPGDIMYMFAANHGKSVDHVVIVVTNGGDGKLTIFEAATNIKTSAEQQVRERTGVHYGEFDGVLRFKK